MVVPFDPCEITLGIKTKKYGVENSIADTICINSYLKLFAVFCFGFSAAEIFSK